MINHNRNPFGNRVERERFNEQNRGPGGAPGLLFTGPTPGGNRPAPPRSPAPDVFTPQAPNDISQELERFRQARLGNFRIDIP